LKGWGDEASLNRKRGPTNVIGRRAKRWSWIEQGIPHIFKKGLEKA